MIVYSKNSVFDESLNRLRYLFDEFNDVVVSFSGGKDSTVILELALRVAEEKGRLPLKVLFLDQEAEWECVIDYVRRVMNDPRVEPIWLQIPLKMPNSSSGKEQHLICWEQGKESEWIRPKEPMAISENTFGTEDFYKLFTEIARSLFSASTCYISGVRTEESPGRKLGLCEGIPTYKWITWGKVLNKGIKHYTFYPIYDWSYTDVWKFIHDNELNYCKLYDYMYQRRIPIQEMRVSCVLHETATRSLFFLQEVESDTWNRICKRVSGVNTTSVLKNNSISAPKELPYMFESWEEYRDYIVENIILCENLKKRIKNFIKNNNVFEMSKENCLLRVKLSKVCINAMLRNDVDFTILKNIMSSPIISTYRKWKQGKILTHELKKPNKYIQYEINKNHNQSG